MDSFFSYQESGGVERGKSGEEEMRIGLEIDFEGGREEEEEEFETTPSSYDSTTLGESEETPVVNPSTSTPPPKKQPQVMVDKNKISSGDFDEEYESIPDPLPMSKRISSGTHHLFTLPQHLRTPLWEALKEVHSKLFSNYRAWCKHLRISPQFGFVMVLPGEEDGKHQDEEDDGEERKGGWESPLSSSSSSSSIGNVIKEEDGSKEARFADIHQVSPTTLLDSIMSTTPSSYSQDTPWGKSPSDSPGFSSAFSTSLNNSKRKQNSSSSFNQKSFVHGPQVKTAIPKPAFEVNTLESCKHMAKDISLYLLIWGEAANIRHSPEILCYLYHKTMQDLMVRPSRRPLYSGHFLDHVITPLYDVFSHRFKGKPREEAPNYDDFNEFFWSPNCLCFHPSLDPSSQVFTSLPLPTSIFTTVEESISTAVEEGLWDGSKKRVPIAQVMSLMRKSYLEKRSWIHPFLSLKRIFKFFFITLFLLTTIGVSRALLWDLEDAVHVISAVFIASSAWDLVFDGILEVWSLFPACRILPSTRNGLVLRLVGRTLQMVLQSICFMESFVQNPNESETKSGENDDVVVGSDDRFMWFTYYLLLSLCLSIFDIISLIFQFIPSLQSRVLSMSHVKRPFIASLSLFFWPSASSFIGKVVHEKQHMVLQYSIFWASLLLWKLIFSYSFEVQPLILPSIELYDDYINQYPTQPTLVETLCLLFLRWIPTVLVYILDVSLWYAVWIAVVGSGRGLLQGLGEIRTLNGLRNVFKSLPNFLCNALVIPTAMRKLPPSLKNQKNDNSMSLSNKPSNNNMKWLHFSHIWNQLVRDLRKGDLLSNNEEYILLFHQSIKGREGGEDGSEFDQEFKDDDDEEQTNARQKLFSDLVSLPLFQTAGVVEKIYHHFIQNCETFHSPDIFQNISSKEQREEVAGSVIISLDDDNNNSNRRRKDGYNPVSKEEEEDEEDVDESSETKEKKENNLIRDSPTYMNQLQFEYGKITEFYQEFDVNLVQKEALRETWGLLKFLSTRLLGSKHQISLRRVIDCLESIISTRQLFYAIHIKRSSTLLRDITKFIKMLRKELPIYKSDLGSESKKMKKKKDRKFEEESTPKSMYTSEDEEEEEGENIIKQRGHVGLGLRKSQSHQSLRDGNLPRNRSTTFFLKMVDEMSGKEGGHIPLKRFQGDEESQNGKVGHRLCTLLQDHLRKIFISLTTSLIKSKENRFNATSRNSGENNTIDLPKCILEEVNEILNLSDGFFWESSYTFSQLQFISRSKLISKAIKKLSGLLTMTVNEATTLKSQESVRRLTFFSNSLLMKIPSPISIKNMKSLTTLTPYYSEEVLLSRGDLESEPNPNGITTMLYLQTLYKSEWENYLERVGISLSNPSNAWSPQFLQETRMWASMRAQTLFRTVEGIMQYQRALGFLGSIEDVPRSLIPHFVKQKCSYIVTCQVFGNMIKNHDPKAKDIIFLLNRHPNLRIAYIDAVSSHSSSAISLYSVLVRGNSGGSIQEVFRIKLPGNPILGEGKPENQNHAIIFSRGEYLQAIDMNQEGYFEEALKMRNLLKEFEPSSREKKHGAYHYSTRDMQDIIILGFREHIFTGSVSSLANFMALQELSFVTLGQRVLDCPLRVRQHYGHPDIFNKLFVMTRGGVSKASKGVNLSEDIFAGFNVMLRSGKGQFVEYSQVGKGRDVGMHQLFKFEAKLAQGNAEQILSRDISRLARRLNFFRIWGFYLGSVGHYFTALFTIAALDSIIFSLLLLSLFNVESIGGRSLVPEASFQYLLAILGLIQTIPLFATLTVERGVNFACLELGRVFLCGGPLYFLFHIQTRAHYFSQTILAGGATYRPTGRGFVIHHSSFDDNFRFFASSHLHYSIEMILYLILFGIFTGSSSYEYFGRTWSLWLAAVSFLFSPFWFNPMCFEWENLSNDYQKFHDWIFDEGGDASTSWISWWREETSYLSKLKFPSKILLGLRHCLLPFILSYGIIFRDEIINHYWRISHILLLFLIYAILQMMVSYFHSKTSSGNEYLILSSPRSSKSSSNNIQSTSLGGVVRFYALSRTLELISIFFLVTFMIVLIIVHKTYILLFVATYLLGSGVSYLILLAFKNPPFISNLYKHHDYLVGHIVFGILFILSAVKLPSLIQTWLLFHNALDSGVAMDELLRHHATMRRKRQQQDEDTEDEEEEEKEEVKKKITIFNNKRNVGMEEADEQQSLLSSSFFDSHMINGERKKKKKRRKRKGRRMKEEEEDRSGDGEMFEEYGSLETDI